MIRLLFMSALALLGATSSAEEIAPARAEQLRLGAQVFEHWCLPCHAAGPGHPGTMRLAQRIGSDKSVLLARTDLLEPYIQAVVRTGFQMMPPFKETEISPAELEAVAAYVVTNGGQMSGKTPTAAKRARP